MITKVKDFFWQKRNGEIMQIRIQYELGYIQVYSPKGKRVMEWSGLTRDEIIEIESHFDEVIG